MYQELKREHIEKQVSYLEYAQAAKAYGLKPTIDNWEKKEKAFETYNALIDPKRNNS